MQITTNFRPTRFGTSAAFVAVLFVMAASACVPPPAPPAGWHQRFLTRDGGDVTTITVVAPGRVEASSPASNVGTNSRTVFGPIDAPVSVDQEACLTATHNGGVTQEGLALRVRTDGERFRAITVTKNVWGLKFDNYNVHTWDVTAVGQPPAMVAGFAFDPAIFAGANSDAVPRRMCARVVGDQLTIKVWSAAAPEPDWTDPVHTRTATLGPQWVYEGQPGFYVGHLGRPGWAVYTDTVLGAL